MNFIKKHKIKIIAAVCIIAALIIAFFIGGSSARPANDNSSLASDLASEDKTAEKTVQKEDTQKEAQTVISEETNNAPDKENIEYSKESETDKDNTEPAASDKISPSANEETNAKSELSCTLSVKCDRAIGKSKEKASVIPSDGIIFPNQEVAFYEGESVFDVLVREMKKNKIHIEFVNTPVYNSAYIEGIGNLYEFDCGELSGWMYKVNGMFPNYGCSLYKLKSGDKIEWVYTCDLGKDVGRDYSSESGIQNE